MDYLTNQELEFSLKKYLEAINLKLEEEEIDVKESYNRITSQPVYAIRSSPNYVSSAMDGIATIAEKTFGATETTPIILKEKEDFIRVDTGDPITNNYDTVIMLEDLIKIDHNTIKIINGATPFQNIRQIGEDIAEKEMIITSHTLITPEIIGSLINCGVKKIKVFKKIKVAIIPTGDEIINFDNDPKIGEIVESNSFIFSNMLKEWGAEVYVSNIIKDNYEQIKNTILNLVPKFHIILIIGGSSKGRDDLTAKIINDIGKILINGIAIKPGKPTILGFVNEKIVIGLPGYPVSGITIMNEIVKKIFEYLQGYCFKKRETIKAKLSKRIVSSLKSIDFVRTKLTFINNNFIAIPSNSGAGFLVDYIKADGIIKVPLNKEGYEEGEVVEVELLKEIEEIKNSLSIIGSHDPLIDEIGDIIKKRNPKISIKSSNVGSIGGIMAIKRNLSHLASIHLLDETSGKYNLLYIKKYLANEKIAIIKGVKRIQGLIFNKDIKINSIKDIVNNNLKFINRQKGSGTRILFDYLIKKENISKDEIQGYYKEEFTHIGVALQIIKNNAQIGMSIYSVAKMFDLNFLPLWEEEYDFLIREENIEEENIKLFIEIIKSKEFKNKIAQMEGYKIENIGEIIYL